MGMKKNIKEPSARHMTDGPYSTAPTKIQGLLDNVPKEVSGASKDAKTWCPQEITPLTNDYDKLRNKVSHMWPTDYTYIPMGLAWGRRVWL